MTTDTDTAHHRHVRSFVRREGRMTEAQQRALDALFARYGLAAGETPLDYAAIFGREAPVVLEVGFGNGESLATMAAAHPERDYIGVEVHRPGIGRLLNLVEQQGLENVRVIDHDGVEVMKHQIPPASLAGIQLYFPDPWPKKRHHKRRIVQPDWVALAASRLEPGGWLHMATDWENYALHMHEVMEASTAFDNAHGAGCFAPGPGERPRTKFEERGARKGHGVWDLVYRRRPAAATPGAE
ncbi:tRNA (guanosine(46)-N7)-methyltransferase TrmB [Aquisalimonas asiatica]|uniref:tRNA (guanine-N(7)-)-methyltransferase n=1 Tax=Aquisalimonas asiatica TaxID=406100 RepID=A0A1H8VFC3_9GAMM|nr:tRNA (guanosine(46)-N7)-methyltransferase TrmB [Aquisalimonas asiatica]SEP13907.1 tRNA (guanine-N(7)-)-methyltransferase [Aquisalimonas asiatica]